jgi:hypothetical protein
MFMLEEMVGALQQGKWEIDCVEMALAQNDIEQPMSFSGPGYLRQDEDGMVTFKVYPTAVEKYNHWTEFGRFGTPGKLIEPSRYYNLKAKDRYGQDWKVVRTLAEVGGSFLEDGPTYVVDGRAAEIASTRATNYPADYQRLVMYFFSEAKVPCNVPTETMTVIGGQKHRESSSLNVASVATRFGTFRISKRTGLVVVEVESGFPFPPHFEVRIVEALGLALAKPLFWNVIELQSGGTETVRVRGQRVAVEAKLPPPSGGGDIDDNGQVWVLFDKYLAFVCGHTDSTFHPCSRHLFSVLEASAGAISAKALALGVAVEGIVKELFPKAGALCDGLKPKVRELRKHFEKWEGFQDDATQAALLKRVQDMLGRILEVSTKSKLYALVNDKVVYEAHVKAWGELRNKSAHGVTPGSRDHQELVDLCNQVTVLLYHLIFRAIGFDGGYLDYSTHGWPLKRYRGRPVTDAEIAVAAYFMWERAGREHGRDVEHWITARASLEQGLI